MLVASCNRSPTAVEDVPVEWFGGVPSVIELEDRCVIGPYPADPLEIPIQIVQQNSAPNIYYRLPALEADNYAISDSAVPGFEIFSDLLYPDRFPAFVIVTAMNHPDECRRFTEFLIDADPHEAIEFEGVEDWAAVAGADAVRALQRIRTECMGMSREEAIRTFGDFGFRAPDGEILEATTPREACFAATQAWTYALRITTPDGAAIISNVFGEIFIEEIN